MKRFFAFLAVVAFLACFEVQAQTTYGSGQLVGGTNWVYSQNSPGVYGTNFLNYSQPPRSFVLGQISNTNEVANAYYGFVVPSNYSLLPGTTNVYVTSSTNFTFTASTNGGSISVSFNGIYGQQVPLQSVMGISLSPALTTNTVYASP